MKDFPSFKHIRRPLSFLLPFCITLFSASVLSQPALLAASPIVATDQGATTEKVNAAFWLGKLKNALTKTNFQAGIVTLKGEKTESFQWSHGYVAEQNIGIEKVAPLIGGGVTTVRRGNTVAFIEPNKEPYAVTSPSIRNFIPPVFYKDAASLSDSYQFVLVSKSQIAGRSAQLIRIESISKHAFNYWVWIDVISGLPLRLAFVDEMGEVKEQVLMTHLSLNNEPKPEMLAVLEMDLPQPAVAEIATQAETNNWQMTWLPDGFKLIKSDRHHVSISREVSDYYLYSDDLVEISIYVQRPLDSFKSPIVLKDGATSFVMLRSSGFDVTVVGKVPAEVAYQIATNVKRVQPQ